MSHNPCHVFVYVGRIDDQQEFLFFHTVYEQVVDSSSVGVQHHSVKNFPYCQIADIVREYIIDKAHGLRPRHQDFPHMRNVEHPDLLTHSFVFGYYVTIFNRHIEASERAHFCSRLDMAVIKGCFFQVFHVLNMIPNSCFIN